MWTGSSAVERPTLNRMRVGSIPTRSTNPDRGGQAAHATAALSPQGVTAVLAKLVRHSLGKGEIAGSSPADGTIALVAQLDRAFGYGPEGWGFESSRVHHTLPVTPLSISCRELQRDDVMEQEEWVELWKQAQELQSWFPEGVVFIGGVATAAYSTAIKDLAVDVPFSHDVDLMISTPDYTDLKDIEAMVPNRRLSRSQFMKAGFEFDVYVENVHGLPVPYSEAAADSVMMSDLRVASIGHMIVLKLTAWKDRKNSPKGLKDADDLLRLMLCATKVAVTKSSVARITEDDLDSLKAVLASDAAVRLASGNLHEAAILRQVGLQGFETISARIEVSPDKTPSRSARPH